MAELNLSVCIMPAKHSVSVSVHMNDTIADMKTKLSVTVDMCIQKQKVIDFPVESMKIVNAGRPCSDTATIEEIGLNYCSRVICAAKGFVPKGTVEQSSERLIESNLLIKLDGCKSVNVPYGMSTTWRQLKVNLQV